jgi:hypothetical protein
VIDLLIADIATHPEVFFLKGAAMDASIPAEICGLRPPDDLVAFWQRFGGGELFESERILLPTTRATASLTGMDGDDVESVTAFQRAARPKLRGAVFHTGSWTSTFLTGNIFLVFNGSDELIGSFNDLDSWYAALPRKEFADRYGLTKILIEPSGHSKERTANPAKSHYR